MHTPSTDTHCPACGALNTEGNSHCAVCSQPLIQIDDTDTEPMLLNQRYQREHLLGSGGFSAVYKAVDTWTHTVVAIKQISLKNLTPQQIIDATDTFNRETQLLTILDHPRIPRFHEQFQDAEHWYLVLDFLPGQTLEAYLHTKASSATGSLLSLVEMLNLAMQLCHVLSYLHERKPPVIFRDLKPGNIMCTPDGNFSLIDFGIARRYTPGKSKDTIPLGSPGYAAPEQYGKAQTTPRADIYSLGALLYYLLSGNDPGDKPFNFPPLRAYTQPEGELLNDLIQRMVALNPQERPASIQEVLIDLNIIQEQQQKSSQRQGIQHLLFTAGTPGSSTAMGGQVASTQQMLHQSAYTSRRSLLQAGMVQSNAQTRSQARKKGQQAAQAQSSGFFSRRDALVGGLAVAGLMVLGIPQIFRGSVPAPFKNLTDMTGSSQVRMQGISWSPDLQYAIEAVSSYDLVITHSTAKEEVKILGKHTVSQLRQISWSTDNTYVLIEDDTQARSVYRRDNGERVSYNSKLPFRALSVAWSPLNSRLAVGGVGKLYLLSGWSLQGTERVTLPTSTGYIPALSWSPDSQRVAFLQENTGAGNEFFWQVGIYDRRSSQTQTPTQMATFVGPNHNPQLAWSPDGSRIAALIADQLSFFAGEGLKELSTHTLALPEALAVALIWSPDNNYLAIALQTELFVWHEAKHTLIRLTQPAWQNGEIQQIAWTANSRALRVAFHDQRTIATIGVP